ncbi:SIR4-interacting protein Sif2p [[Candida] railenensis]|uniref:SIR4-interacting protein Sif2p n=1 Tax=[Candida] railenensis TaxID=45579 RepID=A0A9P0QKP5_9ASCO|nr:SIR4-interacting protein Sif2p [[Candida] railenensis]
MSLTSTELNYLVWRYLQESGSDLAAYALEKHSQCSSYEGNKNLEIIKRIQPGCLIDLVQKGILYSLAEHKASTEEDSKRKEPPLNSILSLFGAVLEDEHLEEYVRKAGLKDSATCDDIEKKGIIEGNGNGVANGGATSGEPGAKQEYKPEGTVRSTPPDSNAEEKEDDHRGEHTDSTGAHPSAGSQEETDEGKPVVEEEVIPAFNTKLIHPNITFPSSITSHWHPKTEVFAYGREDSLAVIVALSGDSIAESVTLTHSTISGLDTKNEISIVSWAPAGNIIVTSAINGELRAWSPDGKLKNIANTSTFQSTELTNQSSTMVSNLIWSESGQFLLSLDIHNQVCLWNGNNLSLIQQVRPPDEETNPDDEGVVDEGTSGSDIQLIDACWLDESKFAISTSKHTIKIFAISHTHPSSFGGLPLAKPIGSLSGHDHPISILKFNKNSKILASCSDFDYIIKIWHSNSLQHSLLLNVSKDDNPSNLILHRTPIISLSWLDDHILMSVSMEGVINIWNVKSGEVIVSTNISETTKESIRIEKEGEDDIMKDVDAENEEQKQETKTRQESDKFILFNASVSSNNKWLVLGDDLGRVTIWDVSLESYPKKVDGSTHSVLRCLGVYEHEGVKSDSTDIGICDISWSSVSNKVCVSYKGCDSVVFDWA